MDTNVSRLSLARLARPHRWVQALVVVLVAGVLLAPSPAVAAASTPVLERIEETSAQLEYVGSWSRMTGGDSGGGLMYLNSPGNVSLTFTGTAVQWISRTTTNSGIARVVLDGVEVALIDRYSPTAKYQQVMYSVDALTFAEHTIRLEYTGDRNSRAAGGNLLIDAFDVTRQVQAPDDVLVTPLTGGYAVSWSPVAVTGVTGYRLLRTQDGKTIEVARTDAATTLLRDETAVPGNAYSYQVAPLGVPATTAAASRVVAAPGPDDPIVAAIASSGVCPPATVVVSTAAQLSAALAAAKEGTSILLRPGRYVGQFKLRNVDGGAGRIWICGPRSAVVTTGSASVGSALSINAASHVTVHGLSFTDSMKAVMIIAGRDVIVRDTRSTDIGYEAIHLRAQTVGSFIIGNEIEGTGLVQAKYGEGVYVGTSSANTCAQNDCLPDRSDGNHIVDNEIADAGAQPIEAKDGTIGGTISGNTIVGTTRMDPASTGLVLVKGNDWLAANNTVTATGGDGLATIFSSDGSGNGTIYAGNRVNGPADYGIWIHQTAKNAASVAVWCSNSVSGGGPVSNVTCGH
ncbi:right-handed parallel beta-helix repeat-containing protein [Microbacterium aurum]